MSTITARKLWQGAFLALALGAILAVFLILTIPPQVAGQSGTPAKPTGLRVTTQDGSLEVSVDWNDVSGATSYRVRWRERSAGSSLNEGITVTDSSAVITVAESGEWVVRVEACTEDGCGRGAGKVFAVTAAEPEETPTPTPTATPKPQPTPTFAPAAEPNPTLNIPARIDLVEGETHNTTGLPAVAPEPNNRIYVRVTHLGDTDVSVSPSEFWIEPGNYDFDRWPNLQITAGIDDDRENDEAWIVPLT